MPIPAPVNDREKSQVKCLLLFREQIHGGSFYTQTRTWNVDPSIPTRAYGQEQINQRYGVKNKATVDPFTAVPMFSSGMIKPERALPDFSSRPFNKEFFPAELHGTLDGDDGPPGRKGRGAGKKKTMALSTVTSLRTAEEIFNRPELNGDNSYKALEALDQLNENDEDETHLDLNDEDGLEEEIDEVYEDEDGGDYDAEQYFENGDEGMDDDGGGDEGEY